MCSKSFPKARSDMGYTICTSCSTEEKKVGHIIYPHKTGAYVQVMDKSTHSELNKLDRRGYKGSGSYKHYKTIVKKKVEDENKTARRLDRDPKVTPDTSSDNIVHIPYSKVHTMVMSYYDEWGYEKTLDYLRQLNRNGDIALMQRVKLQDIVTERYLKPSPRALARKFNKQIT